jgi:hypothetical protein
VPPAAEAEPEPQPEPAAESQPEPEPAAVAAQILPAVDVINLANGEVTNLANLARPGPTLLWFWAPH